MRDNVSFTAATACGAVETSEGRFRRLLVPLQSASCKLRSVAELKARLRLPRYSWLRSLRGSSTASGNVSAAPRELRRSSQIPH